MTSMTPKTPTPTTPTPIAPMQSDDRAAQESRPTSRRTLLALGAGAVLAAATRTLLSGSGDASALAPTTTSGAAATTTTVKSATTTTTTTATSTTAGTTAQAATIGNGAASVGKPAKRLRQMGSLLFPMQSAPKCAILDNFMDGRSGGRRHEGIDILATEAQEVYAVADGVLQRQYVVGGPNSSLSGNAWQLNEPDGTYYFYAHLSAFAAGLQVGDSVRKGQLIGYVGDTGNPGPGNYHLHFEVHPNGGAAVDPLTLLEVPTACSIT